jgi:hypothetical protein
LRGCVDISQGSRRDAAGTATGPTERLRRSSTAAFYGERNP